MHSPAAAIAWEFRRRYRWGWAAIAGYFALMGSIKLWIALSGSALTIEEDETFGLLVMFPMSTTILYVITIFTFGHTGDIAARESMLPSRLLRLPMTTNALTGWLMLYGGIVIAASWGLIRALMIFPAHMNIPIVWPAVLAVVIMAWAQALIWMPYGLRGARVLATVLWLVSIDTVVILALYLKAPEWAIIAILLPQVPIAALVARVAVARARRGEVPDWRIGGATRPSAVASGPAFTSASRAQLWYEWRHHGWNFPALVALVVPVELALFFTAGQAPALVFFLLAGVLVTPPFLARAAGATVRRTSPTAPDTHGISPFLATRPMTSAALVAAKLKVTVASTFIAWLLVVIATPIAMMLSGTWALLAYRFARSAATIGTSRTAVLIIVVGIALLFATWRQLVQSLYIGLTGREWLVKANVFGTLFAVFLLVPFAKWAWGSSWVVWLIWDAIPAILAVLVVVKTVAAIGVYRALARRRVLGDVALLTTAAAWCLTVLVLYATFVWFWDTTLMPSYFLAMVAILIVPLARASAAPLAFDWNRHR